MTVHVAAANEETRGKRANQRARRRRRKVVAAAGAMLLVPAVVSGEPVALGAGNTTVLGDVGRGLMGLTDPDSVNTDGTLSESDQIGADLLRDAGNPGALGLDGLDLPTGPLGIPGVMLQAYQRAATTLATSQPNCHLHWSLLASIGRIESNHGRGGLVFGNGDTVHPILGPVLNGGGFAAIADTDGGRLDGDARWDRAVGVMQFIPSTWAGYASDGNGDRVSTPHNVYDATLAAGKYLCSGGLDLANPQQRAAAVFRYNHSDTYVRVVLVWADAYAKGVTPLPSTPVPSVPPLQQAIAPPSDGTNNGGSGGGGGGGSTSTTTTTTTTTSGTRTTITTVTTTTPTCTTSTTSPTTSTSTTTPPPTCGTTTTTTTTTTTAAENTSTNGGDQSTTASTTITTTTTTEAPADSSSSSSAAEDNPSSAVGP